MSFVMRHVSKVIPDLPPRYWVWRPPNQDGIVFLETTGDVTDATGFPSAFQAEQPFRGSHRDPTSCCQPFEVSP